MNAHEEVRRESLSELLPAERILLGASAQDWEEAIRLAGRLLVHAGVVEPAYVEAMIAVRNELGPYIVIAPGVALPHARPEQGVLRTGFSIVRLKTPIAFGNPDNDPVDLVIALAAVDKHRHVQALQTVAALLGDPRLAERLRAAQQVEEVRALIREVEAQTVSGG